MAVNVISACRQQQRSVGYWTVLRRSGMRVLAPIGEKRPPAMWNGRLLVMAAMVAASAPLGNQPFPKRAFDCG
ncbi:hypothetical protein N234_37205 [Ralstonia pickettii DTP0602]|nr:hypothetical protein N234_37205 [Ralstonia pickettii DTP0602]